MSFRDTDNFLTGPDTNAGITVDYAGGTKNAQSGLFNVLNGSTITKILRLNKADSELTFTSATDNAFITKIVINYNSYYAAPGESVETMSLYVNHEAWTNQTVQGGDGKYTLTMTGNAARSVTLRTGRIYSIKEINSISFYITDNLYTTPNNESGFRVTEYEDGGLKVIHGNPAWPRVGVPFLIRVGGKVAGFSVADSGDTQSVEMANPVDPFTFETISNNTITVTDVKELNLALGSSYINKVNLGSNITMDGGLTISKQFEINLNGKTLSCNSSAANKTFTVTGSDSYTFKLSNGTVTGFDNLMITGHAGISITSGTYYFENILGNTSPLDASITLSGGEFHVSNGMSGWVVATGGTYYLPNGIGTSEMWGNIGKYVKLLGGTFYMPNGIVGGGDLKGGTYKLYDTFDMDTLRNVCYAGYAPFATDEEGWAEVRSHYHDYYQYFYELPDGSVHYIHRCDGCDHTVSDWTLTSEELDTLAEINGGALTDEWQWDNTNPDTTTLKLKITDDTYNEAIAEPYNMNEKAMRDIRSMNAPNWKSSNSKWKMSFVPAAKMMSFLCAGRTPRSGIFPMCVRVHRI